MLPEFVKWLRMEKDIKEKIKEIIGKIECPNKFCCLESGFDKGCEARDIGIEDFLECLEHDPQGCPFSFPFGNTHFCKCPLRVYICKELGM